MSLRLKRRVCGSNSHEKAFCPIARLLGRNQSYDKEVIQLLARDKVSSVLEDQHEGRLHFGILQPYHLSGVPRPIFKKHRPALSFTNTALRKHYKIRATHITASGTFMSLEIRFIKLNQRS